MKKRSGLLKFYFLAFVYLASRVVLLSPAAIEQKSKRVIINQKQYVSILHDSRLKVIASEKAIAQKVPAVDAVKSTKYFFYRKDFQSYFIISYTGSKILASPGEPDVLS